MIQKLEKTISKRNRVKKNAETNNFEKTKTRKIEISKTYIAKKGEVKVGVTVVPHF